MINQFEDYPNVLLNGRPVLEFYDITEPKWAALGYESLFFIFFFLAAWAVSHPRTLLRIFGLLAMLQCNGLRGATRASSTSSPAAHSASSRPLQLWRHVCMLTPAELLQQNCRAS